MMMLLKLIGSPLGKVAGAVIAAMVLFGALKTYGVMKYRQGRADLKTEIAQAVEKATGKKEKSDAEVDAMSVDGLAGWMLKNADGE